MQICLSQLVVCILCRKGEVFGGNALYHTVGSQPYHKAFDSLFVRFARHAHVLDFVYDNGAPGVAILLFYCKKLAFDLLHKRLLGVYQPLKLLDLSVEVFKLFDQLGYFKLGQPCKLQLQNGVRLHLGEIETAAQILPRFGRGLRFFDNRHHLVDILNGYYQSFQNMSALFCFFELKFGSVVNHVALIVGVAGNDVKQPHLLRLAVRDCHHVYSVGALKVCVLEKYIQIFFRVVILFYSDNRAHALLVGLVHYFRNTGKQILFVLAQGKNFRQQIGFVYLIRQLGYHKIFSVVGQYLDMHLGAHGYFSLARLVSLFQLVGNHVAACGEIGTSDDFHHFLQGNVLFVYIGNHAVNDFPEIVGRYVCRKSHRDTAAAVDQNIGKTAGQHFRLLQLVVVVPTPAHRIHVKVAQHFESKRRETRFGITHRRRAVAVHRAEIALSVHERHSHVELLRKTHHSVVNGGVAVRVVFCKTVAYNSRAFSVRPVGF